MRIKTSERTVFTNGHNEEVTVITYMEMEKKDKRGEYTVPSTINGKRVAIGSSVFKNEEEEIEKFYDVEAIYLERLIVSEGVCLLEDCFRKARIKQVVLRDATDIPIGCFQHSDIEEVVFEGSTPSEICELAFFACKSLRSFTWPSTCYRIPDGCFRASSLEVISGIENVSQIGVEAFYRTKIETFKWPARCFEIPHQCFRNTNLKKIEGIDHVKSIGVQAFEGTMLDEITWPSECRRIPSYCFHNSSIKSIKNIENVKSVESRAFDSSQIKTIKWPSECRVIPEGCFLSCLFLKEITNLSNVEQICGSAFAGTAVREMVLEKVNRVDYFAFKESQLKCIKFKNSIITISERAFPDITTIDASCCDEVNVIHFKESSKLLNRIHVGFDTNITCEKMPF